MAPSRSRIQLGPVPRLLRLAVLALWFVVPLACAPARTPPLPVETDPRIRLGEPRVNPRAEAPGAPVDCSVEVGNRSDQVLSRLILRCELLDAAGTPIGVGLGNVMNLRQGESRTVRTIVYGVRSFSAARAQVSSAMFQ